MTNPWPWYALGLAVLALLLYLANAYMAREYQETCDRLIVGSDLDVAPVDWRTLEDVRWAEIEQQWHAFLDSFEVRS